MSFERIKTIHGHKYKYLVESVRIDGKVKQKIIKNLGRVDKKKVLESKLIIPEGYVSDQDKVNYLNEMVDAGKDRVFFILDSESYTRFLRRMKTPDESYSDVFNRILDGTAKQERR